jgi:hypothetical protein
MNFQNIRFRYTKDINGERINIFNSGHEADTYDGIFIEWLEGDTLGGVIEIRNPAWLTTATLAFSRIEILSPEAVMARLLEMGAADIQWEEINGATAPSMQAVIREIATNLGGENSINPYDYLDAQEPTFAFDALKQYVRSQCSDDALADFLSELN